MSIERLTFVDEGFKYNPLEASIHVVRYQVAKRFVKDKKVLDIACGEGYGSWLLKKWGAKSVIGVDIDQDAIDLASKNFASDGISFQCSSAEQINIKEKFDLIISLETIEHVEDQFEYLKNLKSMLSKDGVLIISCPNDYWYYNEDESNEFHLRKYTFDDFVEISESVLGEAKAWYLGSNVFGYGNFRYDKKTKQIVHSKQKLSMMDLLEQKAISSVNMSYNDKEYLPTEEKSLYYVGVWTEKDLVYESIEGVNIFPIKPTYVNKSSIEWLYVIKGWADELEEAIKILRNDNDELRRYNRNLILQKQALEMENQLAKEGISRLKRENIEMERIYIRYNKLKNLIPQYIRLRIRKLYSRIRKR